MSTNTLEYNHIIQFDTQSNQMKCCSCNNIKEPPKHPVEDEPDITVQTV